MAAPQGDPAVLLTRLRVLLGLVFAGSALRFLLKGWIDPLYVQPSFRFPYPGFAWVPEPSAAGLTALYVSMVIAGLGVAAGAAYRACAVVLLVCFVWTELIDVSTWLNHYYLMALIALILACLPLNRHGSVDVWLGWAPRADTYPRWMRGWVQGQVAVVYVFAGLAKLNSDWLQRGEPMRGWLGNLGVDSAPLAIGMSWAGMLYDCSIPFWLAWRPSRPWAFATVVGFHTVVGVMFPIGVFPVLMIVLASSFFGPGLAGVSAVSAGKRLALGLWFVIQIAVPLRHLGRAGPVNWTEEGFRFSWRVMLVNKAGYLNYRVIDNDTGRTWQISPRGELSGMQLEQMVTQGDMIVTYAQHLKARFPGQNISVYADSFVSFNGRPSRRYINPEVDLLAELPEGWILPAPGE